jgi:hypothetical protein
MDGSRNRILWLAVIGFAAWQLFDWFGDIAGEHGHPQLRLVLKFLGLLGGLVWAVAMVRSLRFFKRLKAKPAVAAALEDEYVRHARLRASATAFWALLFTQSALVVTTTFVPLTARRGAQISILVGVTVALVSFLRTRAAADDA